MQRLRVSGSIINDSAFGALTHARDEMVAFGLDTTNAII
jgi:hypothetical protein